MGSLSNGLQSTKLEDAAPSAPDERFSALVRDRDTLRAEVTELRKALEEIQSKHQGELEAVQERLDETNVEKEHAETQYRNLLGKVNTIKSQLGERLKADAVCLCFDTLGNCLTLTLSLGGISTSENAH